MVSPAIEWWSVQRNLDSLELMWTAEDHTARRPSPQTSLGRALITFGGADAGARHGAAEWLKAMLQEALKQKAVSSRVDSADQASAAHLAVPGVVSLMECTGYRSKGSSWELAASSDEEVAAVHAALAAVAQDSDAELGLEAGASIDGLTVR